jgi:serine/threonine protein kinase
MSDLFVGSTIAGCRLDAVAGRGGMGVVYRATQLALDRTVALKAIAPRLAEDEAYRERFQRESQLAASLEHPNVIPVYEAGELDGTLYLIMRWVDGTDLRALLSAEGRLDPSRALRLLRPVASALAAAHRRGLIHRDVKPANVLIATDNGEEEHVYLTDFGIAKRTDGQSLTRTGVLVGTLDYTAPERIEGAKGSPATDIYAFGCMLFEALTGHVPYPRSTEIAKMHAHLNEPLPSLAADQPGIPRALERVVATAMAKRPEDRYASAAELVAALDAALAEIEESTQQPTRLSPVVPDLPTVLSAQEPVPTPPPAEPPAPRRTESPQRPRSRLPWLAGAAVAAVVAIVVVIAVAISGGGTSRPNSPSTTASTGTVATANIGTPVIHGPGLTNANPIKLAATPAGIAADGKHAWVIAPGRLIELDAGGARPPITIAGRPTNVAVDARGRVWMTGVGAGGVAVFDPHSRQTTTVNAGTSPNLIALTASAAWLARSGEATITRVPLAGGAPQTIAVGRPIAALGAAFGRLWVAPATGAVVVINDDGSRNALAGPVIPPGTVGISHSNGVWFLSMALTRVDPRTQAATAGVYTAHANQAPVGPVPAGIGALDGDDSIWVLTKGDRSVRRIATTGADNNHVLATVIFPATPGGLAVGDHIIWIEVPGTALIYPIRF